MAGAEGAESATEAREDVRAMSPPPPARSRVSVAGAEGLREGGGEPPTERGSSSEEARTATAAVSASASDAYAGNQSDAFGA